MGKAIVGTVAALHQQCQTLIQQESINDVFISEYTKEGGAREYETLHFFTESHFFEVLHFVSSPEIWIAKYAPVHVSLTRKNFDFANATSESRFVADINFVDSDFHLEFKASSDNCMNAMNIINKYILPRIG